MHPIYKFELTIGNTTRRCYPIYKDDLAKEFEMQSGQRFFRAKLTGKLTFESTDYYRIEGAAFDAKFGLAIYISYDAGQTWQAYWRGEFYKTDCEFDGDAETVTVTPSVVDEYTDILAGLDKEYNLIELAPEIEKINIDKRPMVQVYAPGQTSIGCFLSGMWWEQECEAVEESETIPSSEGDVPALTHKYFFGKIAEIRIVDVEEQGTPEIATPFIMPPLNGLDEKSGTNGAYRFTMRHFVAPDDFFTYYFSISRVADDVEMWNYQVREVDMPSLPAEITLNPIAGTGASGTVKVYIHDQNVYARMICDVDDIEGVSTHTLPTDDLVADNRNYKNVVPYIISDSVYFSSNTSSTPTQWGLFAPGVYYDKPQISESPIPILFPVARNAWGSVSIWFRMSAYYSVIEPEARAKFTLNDAYPLASVISVLLNKIAPEIVHRAEADFSKFLYGTAGSLASPKALFITPKSNIITAGYDQPAQKAPITLKRVLEMLRDCYRCYWFVEYNEEYGEYRLRIEQVRYFQLGGRYTGEPEVGVNLLNEVVTRSGKAWSFAKNQFKFDKPEMAGRYQFGWMDEVTDLFEGYPIDIVSGYANKGSIEEVNVAQFTSDIDYILLNPSEVSKDGFVLLAAALVDGDYALPYYHYITANAEYVLQNGYAAFVFLEDYYKYDMPAKNYRINGSDLIAVGVKRLKEQSIKFPMLTDPDCLKLVKTEIGDGAIQKISVNLSSRLATATLRYDTE